MPDAGIDAATMDFQGSGQESRRNRGMPARPASRCVPLAPADRLLPALPTLRQLQYLIALAKFRSFSRAAQACCVTQSTLSGAIKELEATLGTRLVDRDKRRVVITDAGEEAVVRSRRIVAEAEALLDWGHCGTGPLSGTLRLGVIPTIAPFLLPRLLPPLKAAYPCLALKLREETTAKLLDGLKAGELDAALMAFPYDTPGLETAIVGDDPLLLAEAEAPGDTACPAATAEALADQPLLLLEDGHCLRDHALAACKLPSARVDEFGATSLFTLTRMVEAGYGVTLLPKMAVDAGLCDNTRLAVRPFAGPAPARRIGLAWRAASGKAEDCQTLLGFVRDIELLGPAA
jgi:LysR family hydrogen peroxide-inducible transcriptional activator